MSKPDPFADAARQLETDLAAHATLKASKRYKDAQTHLSRLLADFSLALQLSAFCFTRYPHARQWMQQANADDLLESVVAIPLLVEQGVFNSGRRELRYLLEALVKFVYVDQQVSGDAPLQERLAFLADNAKVPRSSVDPIDWMTLRLVSQPEEFRAAVKQAFKSLSGYVHPSRSQIDERLRRAARGEFSGFEGPKVVEAFNRLTSQTLDLAVVLILRGHRSGVHRRPTHPAIRRLPGLEISPHAVRRAGIEVLRLQGRAEAACRATRRPVEPPG
jgi:hypothetical protein